MTERPLRAIFFNINATPDRRPAIRLTHETRG